MINGKERGRDTGLVIIIDPDKQTPKQAAARTDQFVGYGGRGVLIGGSGAIDLSLFEDTTAAVVETTEPIGLPLWILPGDLAQIPKEKKGITGILNYRDIMGSGGKNFDSVYPPEARQYVSKILSTREIPDVSTLYVLCGDPKASVSQVSEILPLNLKDIDHQQRFFKGLTYWLTAAIDCVFFEAGSGSNQHADESVVSQTRQKIESLSPESILFVSGGIRHQGQVRSFAGVADFVVMGGYFEANGAADTRDFVKACTQQ